MKMFMLGLDLVSHFYASWRQAGGNLSLYKTHMYRLGQRRGSYDGLN